MLSNSNTKINGMAGETHQLLRGLTAPLPELPAHKEHAHNLL